MPTTLAVGGTWPLTFARTIDGDGSHAVSIAMISLQGSIAAALGQSPKIEVAARSSVWQLVVELPIIDRCANCVLNVDGPTLNLREGAP